MGEEERISPPPDSAEGFADFYKLIYQRDLPAHGLRWVRSLYAARNAGKGLIVEAFRGSSKTTTLTIAFTAFRIGLEPHKSNLLIQAVDKAAHDTAQQIADLIEHNAGWQGAFPKVRPDKSVAWGDNGFEVMDIGHDYDKWRAKCTQEKGKDPSFVGLGYRSTAIIGKHPTGVLVVDDIHDENNTGSIIELDMVVRILTGTILLTATPQTWQVIVGTPWTQDDCLARMKATGRFFSMKTPIFVDKDQEEGVERDEPIHEGPHFIPTDRDVGELDDPDEHESVWPERYPREEIEKARQLVGEAEFARMLLLDLTLAEGMHLKNEWLNKYPFKEVGPEWRVVMGVDYASTADKLKGRRRDYFAVAVGRVIPGGGGIVLVDGFRGQVTQGEAENKLVSLASYYPTIDRIGVEAVGKGEEFFHLMLGHSWLPLVSMHPGSSSKGERFENGMALAFQRGKAWVADVENVFLRRFRDEWARWPYGDHDDVLDAVYWMLFAGQHHLAGGFSMGRTKNPFGSLGRK